MHVHKVEPRRLSLNVCSFGLGPAMLPTLAVTFPQGLPPRLLVLGSGGTGKTVLSKQILVDLCSLHLASDEVGVVPFRLVLQDVGRVLEDHAGWQVVVECCSETHGPDSIQAVAALTVETTSHPVLLVLDGLDEAFGHRRSERAISASKSAITDRIARKPAVSVAKPATAGIALKTAVSCAV